MMTEKQAREEAARIDGLLRTEYGIAPAVAYIEAHLVLRTEAEAEIARLREALEDIRHQAETRLTDGDEMGTRAWRIGLVDILAEASAALSETKP